MVLISNNLNAEEANLASFLLPKVEVEKNLKVKNITNQNFPNEFLLKELKARLIKAPECLPNCATIARMHLDLMPKYLQIKFEVHAEINTAIPLAGNMNNWLPQQIILNDKKVNNLMRDKDGFLWINLPKGTHQILLSGLWQQANNIQLPLPLKPQYVTYKSQGWMLEGLHSNGLVDKQLQFTREQTDETLTELEIGNLPPFVHITRTLSLGLEWQIITEVKRLTPRNNAIVLKVPLLKGESIISEYPNVQNNHALINMSANSTSLVWHSKLDKSEIIELIAPNTYAWNEIWRLDVSPIWHVELGGIPVIHHQNKGRWLPEWRPWNNEKVTIKLTKPLGVAGQIMTIESSLLNIQVGQHAVNNTLDLTIRSSRGGQHQIKLPENSILQDVKINNKTQPIRQNGANVILPITPSKQDISIRFMQNNNISHKFATAKIDLGQHSVNAKIKLNMPNSRWILFVNGPTMGPAILFYGNMIIIILIAFALGRIKTTPLKTYEWILLGLVVAQVHIASSVLIIGWLLILDWRNKIDVDKYSKWKFNAIQIMLVLLTLVALGTLIATIENGLLGHPDMQITGNASNRYTLNWYQDRSTNIFPQAQVISIPLFIYRASMLIWALWLAFALLRWLRWGWNCFSANGLWKKIFNAKIKV
jgi:hypothetical protein